MAKNIAVLGDGESIKGFSAVGLDIFPCDDAAEAGALLRRVADSDRYAVIYLTESVYLSNGQGARALRRAADACHHPHSGCDRQQGHGRKRLSSFVEKAVGSDIIFND